MPNPYVNKVVQSNGTTLIDISDTTAVAADVASGKYFYLATGEKVVGSGSGGSSGYTRTVVVPEQTVTPISDGSRTSAILSAPTGTLVEGGDYIITFNGDEFWFTCVDVGWGGFSFIGVEGFLWGTGADTFYPCLIMDSYGDASNLEVSVYDSFDGTQVTIKVEKIELTGGGGGSSILITKTITANGTYDAEDDSADGYSSVTVNVPSSASKNVQTAQTTDRRNNTALGSIISLTCSTAGTYDVYWTCARSNTSQTWGSQLYINGTAYGTENTTWSNNVQNNHLTGVSLSANDTVAVYGRSRSGYYIYAPHLSIVQTA